MKSFKQFCEEASLSDEQRQKRLERVANARKESSNRKQITKQFVTKNKQKTLSAKQAAQKRSSEQKQRTEKLNARRAQQSQLTRQKISANAKNAKKAIKGTYKLGKSTVNVAKKLMTRKPNP
jgi:hypothetical protein